MTERGVAAAPIVVSVARVLRRPGVQIPIERTVTTAELRVGEAAVAAGTPIDVTLVLEASGDDVIASGHIRAVAQCACRRCLEPFTEQLDVEVREIFQPRPVEGETYPVTGETIDLEPLVRDTVLLTLPLAPLCRPDCPGPDPDRFPTVIEGESVAGVEGHTAEGEPGLVDPTGASDVDVAAADAPVDPRWAALRDLRLDR